MSHYKPKPRTPSPGTGSGHPFQEPTAGSWLKKLGENPSSARGNRAAIEQYWYQRLRGRRQRVGEREGGRDRGLPCAVVDDDGRARGGVHGWQLRRVPAGSCRRRRCREAGHRGGPPRSRPRSLSRGRPIEPSREGWALAGGGLGSGRSIRDRMARGLERDSGRRVAWRWGGDLTS
jgi:hypothetical protein